MNLEQIENTIQKIQIAYKAGQVPAKDAKKAICELRNKKKEVEKRAYVNMDDNFYVASPIGKTIKQSALEKR